MIRIENFSFKMTNGKWSEELPSVTAQYRQSLSIIGPSGSGKTAFCLLLCGVAQGMSIKGKATFCGRDITTLSDPERARLTAYVPSDTTLLFSGIKSTLRGEFELAWQLLGDFPSHAVEVQKAIEFFGVEAFLDRDPFTLSGGETARAAIALALVKGPELVVIDQAYENLDSRAVREIRDAVRRYLPETSIIVEAYSRTPPWLDDVPNDYSASNSSPEFGVHGPNEWKIIVRDRDELTRQRQDTKEIESREPKPIAWLPSRRKHSLLLKARLLKFHYEGTGFELSPLNLKIYSGDRVALIGPNGVGKTTLLKCLAMLLIPEYEEMIIQNENGISQSCPNMRQLHLWAANVLYCFQNPDDQLYLPTVKLELFETAQRLGRGETARPLEIAERLGLLPYLDQSPFELPRPFRRLLSIASVLAAGSPLALLDEPTVGLDETQIKNLVDLLQSFGKDGKALMMVSHDSRFISSVANRTIELPSIRALSNQTDKPHSLAMCPIHS